MAERDPLIALRIPPDLDQRLRADVEARGTTITEVVRGLLADTYPANGQPASKPHGEFATKTNSPKRKRETPASCSHRVRPGAYCNRCERLIT